MGGELVYKLIIWLSFMAIIAWCASVLMELIRIKKELQAIRDNLEHRGEEAYTIEFMEPHCLRKEKMR